MVEQTNYKTNFSIVFIGHVDAGKSTLCGNILVELGEIDHIQLRKLQQQAAKIKMDSRYLSHYMDFLEDEKQTGKTLEFNKKILQFRGKTITMFDAPGHTELIPTMISTIMMSEVAVVVISAVQNEFQAGFTFKNGQEGSSRQHLKILNASNAQKIIIAINKMDHETVKWNEDIYNQRVQFTKGVLSNYYSDKEILSKIQFIPISAHGENVGNNLNRHRYEWYNGQTLFDMIDSLELPIQQSTEGQIFIGLQQKFDKKNGITGLVHKGSIKVGDKMTIWPYNIHSSVLKIEIDANEENEEIVNGAIQGQWVTLYLSEQVSLMNCSQVVLSRHKQPVNTSNQILVQVDTFKFPSGKYVLPFQQVILHTRGTYYSCQVTRLLDVDMKKVICMRDFRTYNCVLQFPDSIVIVKHLEDQLMGSFLLRIDDTTIAKGKVMKYARK